MIYAPLYTPLIDGMEYLGDRREDRLVAVSGKDQRDDHRSGLHRGDLLHDKAELLPADRFPEVIVHAGLYHPSSLITRRIDYSGMYSA